MHCSFSEVACKNANASAEKKDWIIGMELTKDTLKQAKRAKWLLLVGTGLMFFLGFEAAGLQLALLPVANEFALNSTMMGVLVAAQFIAIMVMTPLFGFLGDRVGKKPLTLVAFALFVIGCIITASIRSSVQFIVGVFIIGTGYSSTEGLVSAALTDAYPEKSDRYMNFTQAGFCMGAVLSPVLCNFLMTRFHWSWRIIFVLAGVGFLLLLGPLLLTPFKNHSRKAAVQSHFSLRKFTTLPFLSLVLSILLYVGLETTTGSFLDSLFTKELASGETGAYALSLFWLAMMCTRFLFSSLHFRAKRMLLYCFVLSAMAVSGLALSRSTGMALFFSAVLGAVYAPIWPLLISLAANEFPQNSGTAVSLMSAGCGLGGALFPVITGSMTDSLGLRTGMLLMSAYALIAAFMFTIYIKRKRNFSISHKEGE